MNDAVLTHKDRECFPLGSGSMHRPRVVASMGGCGGREGSGSLFWLDAEPRLIVVAGEARHLGPRNERSRAEYEFRESR